MRFVRLAGALYQLGHHRAFRIAPPWRDAADQARLRQLLADFAATHGDHVEREQEPAAVSDEGVLADAVTNLWRARRRLEGNEQSAGTEARQAGRYLRNSHDALAEWGIRIQDHDGDAFHPGLSLEVLVYEDDPALSTETVLETVKPSVYLRDHRIQMGTVVVGRPVARSDTAEDNNA